MTNPILIRELRGRWRRPLTHIILFAYACVLALLMGVVYAGSVGGLDLTGSQSGETLGHRLFGGFLVAQAGIWTLLPAALTAPTIAGERERGLLQSVMLSPLTSGAIVRGKLLSALWFIALLLLVPMPITSLCFTLGGLSPAEFIIAFVLLGSTAFSGACLGLATSACHRRSDAALLTAFFITLTLCWPPVLVAATFQQSFFAAGAIFCVLYQGMLAAAALGIAADALNNILPEPETGFAYTLATLHDAATNSSANTINSVVLGREEYLSYNRAVLYHDALEPQFINPRQPIPTAPTTPALQTWQETLLSGQVNFRNPIMQREVRARLRRRTEAIPYEQVVSPTIQGNELRIYLSDYWLAGVGLTILFGLIGLFTGGGPPLSVMWILGAKLIAAALGALGFVREREQNTLQPLLLSMLSRGEVLMGKWGAASVLGALFVLPFLPLVLLSTIGSWLSWPLLLLLGLAALSCGAAIGLALSWICRQPGVAVAGALAAALTCFVLTWQLCAYWGSHNIKWPGVWLVQQAGLDGFPNLFFYVMPVCGLWLALAGFLLLCLRFVLRPAALEKDRTSFWHRDLTKE